MNSRIKKYGNTKNIRYKKEVGENRLYFKNIGDKSSKF